MSALYITMTNKEVQDIEQRIKTHTKTKGEKSKALS